MYIVFFVKGLYSLTNQIRQLHRITLEPLSNNFPKADFLNGRFDNSGNRLSGNRTITRFNNGIKLSVMTYEC
jgi:hypothetical protein